MNLLLIDNRVSQSELVVNACLPNTTAILVDYTQDTFVSILEKIPDGPVVSLGIFQENYAQNTYQFLASTSPASLGNVVADSDFQSWTPLLDFFQQIREKTGASKLDFMGCNIGGDANWTAVIQHIQTTLGMEVASSIDATGSESAGGNWILETGNVDLVGKYFTEAIRGYEFILGATSTHSLVLTASGEVYAAGSNTSGCCGLGTAYSGYSTVSEFLRVPVSDISSVSYGSSTSFLLTRNREVLTCGANANGQLGLGTTVAQTDLSFVKANASTRLTNVAAVAAGGSHSVFLLTDGSALACGLNTSGQLGDGTLTQKTFPVAMTTLIESTQPTATKLVHYKFDGNLINEVTGLNDGVLNGACSLSSSIVKFGSGSVSVNAGLTTGGGAGRVDLSTFTPSSQNMTLSFWYYRTSTNNNGVWEYVWWTRTTDNKNYLVGTINGNRLFFYTDKTGTQVDTTIITNFAANQWYHIVLVSSSSDLKIYLNNVLTTTIPGNQLPALTYNWHAILGENYASIPYGYLDDLRIYDAALDATNINFLYTMTNPTSANLNTVASISSVSAGTSHTVLLKRDTGVLSCGTNVNGRLGYISLTDSSFVLPVRSNYITPLTGVSQVAAGGSHSLAVTSFNNVYAWGANTQGQLGINSNVDASYATLVLTAASATLSNIVQVAAGTSHSLFLTSTGTVFACGLNTSGQLGNNTTTSSNQLVSVLNPAGTAALSGISRISATANTSFFLASDGTLYACGSNAQTQMGFPNSGATTFYTLPVQISIVDFGRAKAAGLTPHENRLLGAEPWHQQYYGEQILNLTSAGYSSSALSNSGLTSAALKTAGLTSGQVAALGFSDEQAYPPAFITTTASLSAVSANFTKRANGNFVQSITSAIHNTKFYDMSGSSHFVSGDSADLPPSAFSSTQVWRTELLWNTSTGEYTGGRTTTMSGTSYSGEWVQIRLPVAIKLSSYTFTPSVGRTPVIFYLGGSLDGTTWTLLDSENTATTGGSANRFTVSTAQFFNYYRLVVNTIQTSNDGYLALNRFQLNTTSNVSKNVMSLTDLSLSGYNAMEMIALGVSISSLNNAGISLTNAGSFTVKQLANAGFSYGDIIRNTNLNIVKVGQASLTGSKIGTLMSGGLLDAPRSVSVSGRTTNSISIGITAPSFSSGLTGYSVSAVPVSGGAPVNRSLGVGGTLVDGLEAGKIYDLSVRSVSAGGNSTALTVRNSTAPSLPTLSVGTIGTTTIDVSFSSALAVQDCSYILRTDPNVTQYVLAAGATSQQLTGLNTGTPYSIILDASNLYTSASATSSANTATPLPIYDISNISRSTPFATGTNVCVGFAMSDDMTKAVDLQSGTAARFSTYNGSIWSAWTVFDSSSTIMSGVGDIDLKKDGLRGVLCNGWGNPNGRIYFFTWNVSTYTTCTRIVDDVGRNYRAIALTDDGSRLVACTETAATGGVFFATWNNGSNNYDGLTQVSTTTIPPRIYSGICISDTGTRIAYLEQDGANNSPPKVYFASWSTSTSTYINEVSFNNITARPGDGRKIRMTGDASMIWIGKYVGGFSSNQGATYYSYWNNTTGTYNPATWFYNDSYYNTNYNVWGLWLKRDGTRLAVASYGNTTYELHTLSYSSLGFNEPTYVYNNSALNFQLINKSNTTIGIRDVTNRYTIEQQTTPRIITNSERGNVFYFDASSTTPTAVNGASISTIEVSSKTPTNPFTSNMTLAFWVYYAYDNTANFTFMLWNRLPIMFSSGKLRFIVSYNSAPTIDVTETNITTSNGWVHYAITINMNTRECVLYKNGAVSNTVSNSTTLVESVWGVTPYQTNRFVIGNYVGSSVYTNTYALASHQTIQPITLDDIRIYRIAYTPTEILNLYNSSRTASFTPNVVSTTTTQILLSLPSVSGATSYKVYYGTATPLTTSITTATTTAQITGLTANTQYILYYTSIVGGVESPPSLSIQTYTLNTTARGQLLYSQGSSLTYATSGSTSITDVNNLNVGSNYIDRNNGFTIGNYSEVSTSLSRAYTYVRLIDMTSSAFQTAGRTLYVKFRYSTNTQTYDRAWASAQNLANGYSASSNYFVLNARVNSSSFSTTQGWDVIFSIAGSQQGEVGGGGSLTTFGRIFHMFFVLNNNSQNLFVYREGLTVPVLTTSSTRTTSSLFTSMDTHVLGRQIFNSTDCANIKYYYFNMLPYSVSREQMIQISSGVVKV